MGFSLADAFVDVSVKGVGQAQSQIDSLKNSAGGLSSAFGSLGGIAAGFGITLAAGALGSGLKSCVNAFGEAEEAGAKLAAVVKSTGGAAGLSAAEIQDLAADLQRVTKFEDDATSSAAAMLLTFTSIKGNVFKEAVKSAQDLSTITGQDLKSSVMQLGKALQDPITGVTALRRAGVSFSEEQREQLEKLVHSGKLVEAQMMVLTELQKEFGGAAVAAGDTTLGSIAKMKNAWGDLAETIGGKVAPAMTAAADALTMALQGPSVSKDSLNATVAGGHLADIRAKQQALQDEERRLSAPGFLGYNAGFGLKGLVGQSGKARLIEIQEEQAQLRDAAAKASATEAEQRAKAGVGARALQGAGIFGTNQSFAARVAAGAKGLDPDKELSPDHDKLKTLDSYFAKMASGLKKIRDEANHILDGTMTPAEKLEARIKRITELLNTPGSGMTAEAAKKAADAARKDFLGKDKDPKEQFRQRMADLVAAHAIPAAHGGIDDADFAAAKQRAIDDFAANADSGAKSQRFGMADLASNIQQGIMDGEAKRMARKQAEDMAKLALLAGGQNGGINVKLKDTNFVIGGN